MLLYGYHFRNRSLEDADIPEESSPVSFVPLRVGHALETVAIPIQQTSQRSSEQCHRKTRSKAEDQHTQPGPSQAGQQYRFPADSIAQPAPQDARRELCERKSRSHHSRIYRYLPSILCDVEGRDHVVYVWEDRHESNWLADPT